MHYHRPSGSFRVSNFHFLLEIEGNSFAVVEKVVLSIQDVRKDFLLKYYVLPSIVDYFQLFLITF